MRLWILSIVFLIPAALAFPQNLKKIPVSVSHSGEDRVGQQIAFALKEAIRRSQSFRYVDHESNPSTARIAVHLVSVDSPNTRGQISSIATAIVYDDPFIAGGGIFLTVVVINCGVNRAESCASDMLPDVDRAVEALRKKWSNFWDNLAQGK